MTAFIRVDLTGTDPLDGDEARICPWAVQRALLEAIEEGAGQHALSSVFPDGSHPVDGVHVAHHLRLDVCIVVDDRTPQERAR